MDPQNYKNWCPKDFENERKNIMQSANIFDIILYCKKKSVKCFLTPFNI